MCVISMTPALPALLAAFQGIDARKLKDEGRIVLFVNKKNQKTLNTCGIAVFHFRRKAGGYRAFTP
jgi:hypothetical protein